MKITRFNNSIDKFIKSLEDRTIAKVIKMIDLLEDYGNELRMPYSKKIDTDIFELRINSKQEVRILYTFYNNEIVLLNGFIKDSNEIPVKEIDKAKSRLKRLE